MQMTNHKVIVYALHKEYICLKCEVKKQNGGIKTNPNVMPYETLMSINRVWEDIKEGRYVEVIVR